MTRLQILPLYKMPIPDRPDLDTPSGSRPTNAKLTKPTYIGYELLNASGENSHYNIHSVYGLEC